MSRYALLICRSQTEAVGLRVGASQADDALHRLRQLGISPCRVLPDEGAGQ